MNIGVITDTHFGHANVIEYDGRAEDHENRIICGLYESEYSIIVHLGDVVFYRALEWHERLLEATKSNASLAWLVVGNHDKHSLSWYYDRGWDFMGHEIRLDRYGLRIIFTHRPLDVVEPGCLNIHGHTHKSSLAKGAIGLHMPDNHYKPYSLDALIKRYRKEIKHG